MMAIARFLMAWALLWAADLSAVQAQDIHVARVNGAGISTQELEGGFNDLLKEKGLHLLQVRDPQRMKSMKREVLDLLIENELLWQEAQRAGRVAGDSEVEEGYAQGAKAFKGEERFELRLRQEGYSVEEYKERIRRRLSGLRYLDAALAQTAQVTDEEVSAFYQANADKFRRPEMLHVRHILIRVEPAAGEAERAAARRKIEAILQRARAGERFDELAQLHSEDATRQWGGELDPFPRGTMAKEFEEAAFRLEPGGLSDVVATAAGFHLIKVEQRIPAATLGEQDAAARIRDHLGGTKREQARKKLMDELRARARIEMLLPL
jgi:parvulin-like peptidyl-prolyl isomerase